MPFSPLLRFLESTGRTPIAAEIDTGIGLIERFSQALLAQGYLSSTVRAYRGKCRHFIVWLYLSGIPISTADGNVRNRFLDHDCACGRPIFFRKPGCFNASGRDGYRIGKFLDFLASEGVVEGKAHPPRPEKPDGHLAAFLDWLRRHRGVGEQTLSNYRRFVSALLLDLGDDPGRYDAAMIRDALLRRVKTGSRGQARNLTVSLRMYLRYLASVGHCPPGLVHAVPTIPERSRSTLPRYVSSDDIERTIASCDATTATGSRDKAVLLLLARLALRAGDVANLRLTDIDWNEATISVSGKSRSRMRLPLPQDVGDALKDYVLHVRPRVVEEKVFLRALAPRHLPVGGSGAVSSIARRALERAGIERAGLPAAHTFRHAAADESAAVRRSAGSCRRPSAAPVPKTTAIYAKSRCSNAPRSDPALADRGRFEMMLMEQVERYVALKRALGLSYAEPAQLLRTYAAQADAHGDTFVIGATVLDWASRTSSNRQARKRLCVVRGFAAMLHAEDPRHEVPSADYFGKRATRRKAPNLLSPGQLGRIMDAALALPPPARSRR